MQRGMFSERYRLEERMEASDGVSLYRALDVSFPRKVYVTVFSDCDPSAVESFRARAQSLAALSHHHIMSVYDMECRGDSCYLISEYRECLTLRESLDANRRFSLEEALYMATNLAKAIAHAHERQVVHGHLSADMIWVQGDDIKVAFVCPRNRHDWMPVQKQEDLVALGTVYKELFAATPPLYKPEIRAKVNEVIERLLGKRQPVYTDASDVAYDMKMILAKATNPIRSDQSEHEIEQTRPYEITKAEMKALLGKPKRQRVWNPFGRIRSKLASYFVLSIGILFLGATASLLLTDPRNDPSSEVQTGKESPISVAVAEAEAVKPESTIKITPKEPITKVGDQTAVIPNLIGLERQDAEKLLLALGLRYQYFIERSDKPAGTVFKQVQPPNHPYIPGERVTFYVSSGM